MKIGITGAHGFIGWHLRCYLHSLDGIDEVRLAGRETFSDTGMLVAFVSGLDIIFHFAGVNRAEESELLAGNTQPAEQLRDALLEIGSRATVLYSSSTYAENAGNPYGHAKARAGQILEQWARDSGGRCVNAIIPHVFGEYGRPFYNSAVATFCHQIARGEEMQINPDGRLELVHVQDLVEMLLAFANDDAVSGGARITGRPMGVTEVVDRLKGFYEIYMHQGQFPDLADGFDRSLFNTLRGFIPHDQRLRSPVKHADERGWLVETVRAASGGQCFVSTTRPGITRGNHFHRRKVERFFVLKGKGRIQLRRLFADEVVSYELDGDKPSYVDMPTLHTHAITNIGDEELVTLFWADEFFDPEHPDTYYEPVVAEEI